MHATNQSTWFEFWRTFACFQIQLLPYSTGKIKEFFFWVLPWLKLRCGRDIRDVLICLALLTFFSGIVSNHHYWPTHNLSTVTTILRLAFTSEHICTGQVFLSQLCNPHFHKTCHAQVIKGGVHLSELLFSKIELTVLTPVSLVCGFAGMVFATEQLISEYSWNQSIKVLCWY